MSCLASTSRLASKPRKVHMNLQYGLWAMKNSPLLILHWNYERVAYVSIDFACREEAEGQLKGILGYTDEDAASNDFIGDSRYAGN